MPRPVLLLAALAALAAGCGMPRHMAREQVAASAVGLDHAALHVADLTRSIDFYERVFGVEEIPAPGDPTVIRWVGLGNGTQLHFIHYDGAVPRTSKALHFALRVADLDVLVAHVAALGIPYSNWPGAPTTLSVRADGIRQIYVQDPDGYWIEVNDAR